MSHKKLHISDETQKMIFDHYASLMSSVGTKLPETYISQTYYNNRMVDGYLVSVVDITHNGIATKSVRQLEGINPYRLQDSRYYCKTEYMMYQVEELNAICVSLVYPYETWRFVSISEMKALIETHEQYIIDKLRKIAFTAMEDVFNTVETTALDVDFEAIFKHFEQNQQ